MIEHEYYFRVAYSDTDRMGTVHHSNYVKYFEVARWELLRSIGLSYSDLEAFGVMCPVVKMNLKYIKTTRYDELLKVKTTLKSVEDYRIIFTYKLYNEKSELINKSETELLFVGTNDWKLYKYPEILKNVIDGHLLKRQ
jgi:acyl-CoA thioester hydrolase